MRQAGALILVIVLAVPLALAALSVLSVSPWALERQFYLDLLSEPRIYEALLQEVLNGEVIPDEAILDEGIRLYGVSELEGLNAKSRAALVKAMREALTADYLRGEGARNTNGVFDALEGKQRPFEPYLDLEPLKRRLRGEAGRRFARDFVQELPGCAEGEDPFGGGAGIPRCLPRGMTAEQAEALVRESLPELADRLPDHWPIAPLEEAGGLEWERRLFVPVIGTSRLVLLGVLLGVVSVGALLGAAFLAGQNRRETVLWIGWPLLVPAALIFLGGLSLLAASHLGRPLFMDDPLLGPAFARMPETAEALYAMVRSVLRRVASGFLTWGGIALGAAVGLIVWGYLIPRERPE